MRCPVRVVAAALLVGGASLAENPDDSFAYREELREINEDLKLAEEIEALEAAKTDPADVDYPHGVSLRSRHFVFGMPRLTDDRYVAAPGASGFSVIFREPFVVGYSETMLCPIWVSQRWSRDEVVDHDDRTPSLERDWREDPELPVATRAGTSYRGTVTGLDRGHMARHAMNRAWGLDGSIVGCLMSNSVPQHLDINRGKAWGDLEDAARDVVDPGSDIDVVWVISGALFRDTENPPAESPDEDMERAAEITDGFRVPYATYKIVAWFGADGDFQARGYVFEQPYDVASGEAPKKSDFTIPDQNRSPVAFIRPIDEIETRAGVDFFPWLRDSIENAIESAHEGNLWGED